MSNPVLLRPNKNVPAIPKPTPDVGALAGMLNYVRQGLQNLAGQIGPPTQRAVTFDDLIALGLVSARAGLAQGSAGSTTIVNNVTTVAGGGGGGGAASSGARVGGAPIWGTSRSSGAWARPALAGMTWVTQGNATAVEIADGPIVMSKPSSGGFAQSLLGIAVPTTPTWTVACLIEGNPLNASGRFGMGVSDIAGNIITWGYYTGNSNLYATDWSVSNGAYSYDGNICNGVPMINSPRFWLRIRNDGTTHHFDYSTNGFFWLTFGQQGAHALLGTPNLIGICADGNGSENDIALYALVVGP